MKRLVYLFALLAYLPCLGVTLTWTDNDDSEDGFRVYVRRASTDPWSLLQEIPVPDTEQYQYSPPLVGGEHFEYQVTAYGQYGESEPSNVAVLDIDDPNRGWVFWMKGDGGIYVYGEGLGWAFTTAESLPYVFFFGQGGWKPIIFTPAKIP